MPVMQTKMGSALLDCASTRRQCERNDATARRRVILAASANDHDVLTAVDLIDSRSRVAGCRQLGLPQESSSKFVEGAKFLVEVGGTDKEQSAGGYHRATVVVAPGVFHSFCNEVRILAEWNFPADLAAVEINGIERAPGRRDGRITIRIAKKNIPFVSVFLPVRVLGCNACIHGAGVPSGDKKFDYFIDAAAQVTEARHATAAFPDNARQLLSR